MRRALMTAICCLFAIGYQVREILNDGNVIEQRRIAVKLTFAKIERVCATAH